MEPGPESPPRLPPALRWMSGDGERHGLQNTLALLALGLGVASVLCLLRRSWDAAGWLGLGAGLVAAYDEFIARTSGERWLILLGFLLALVGVAVAMANGAIFGVGDAP